MKLRSLISVIALTILAGGCKSMDVFVKDPHEKEQSSTQEINRQTERFASINAPERSPAATIICTENNQRRQGDKVIVRKECTDMDGVMEPQDLKAVAEW